MPPMICDAGDERRGETGDAVRVGIAEELEQVRLGGVEDVDADSAGERRREHQPAHGRVAQAAVDRAVEHVPDGLEWRQPADGREAHVAHEPPRDDERHAEHRRAHEIGNAKVGRPGR